MYLLRAAKILLPFLAALTAFPVHAAEKSVEELIDYIVESLVNPAITLFLILASAIFIWGVIEFLAGSANEEAHTKGKKHMIWGLIGLLIMISVKMIIAIIENFFDSAGIT